MKLGARVLKTGIAIVLALTLAELLNLPSPIFAGIAAVFAIQPTIYRSYLSVIEQLQANIIGGAIAVIFVMLFGNHVFIIGLAAIVAIMIILKLRIETTIGLALVTIMAIMQEPGEHFIEFAFIRIATIMLGVLSSFAVNLAFIPPKYETKLYHKTVNVTEDTLKWIRLSTRHASEHTLLKKDIERIKERLMKLDQLYLMYKEERNYFRSKEVLKTRKLVIYRQMISTTRRSLNILRRLHRFDNDFQHLPEDTQLELQGQLDGLITYHEQLLLKFAGKIRPNVELETESTEAPQRKELVGRFLHQVKQDQACEEVETYHFLHLISDILEYEENLVHLEKLINSFQTYHQKENTVRLDEIEDER